MRLISAANFLKQAHRRSTTGAGSSAGRRLDAFVERAAIAIEPVTEEQVRPARQAYATISAVATIAPSSTSATASLMRWRRRRASPCYSRATISSIPMSSLRWFLTANLLMRPIAQRRSLRRLSFSSSWGLWLRERPRYLPRDKKPDRGARPWLTSIGASRDLSLRTCSQRLGLLLSVQRAAEPGLPPRRRGHAHRRGALRRRQAGRTAPGVAPAWPGRSITVTASVRRSSTSARTSASARRS